VVDPLPSLYAKQARQRGLDDDTIQSAMRVHRVVAKGATPILSLAHLAHSTGASYSYLRGLVTRRLDAYTPIQMRKSSGSIREIHAPEPMLCDVQRWILDRCLVALPRHDASFAYHRGTSIVQCARQHAQSDWLLKLDLHDFFHSITETQVYRVFRSLGYSRLVSFELARITTFTDDVERHGRKAIAKYPRIPAYAVNDSGVLAQGAPTSGALANAAARGLDNRLQALGARYESIYTRYSDDIVFSGNGFDRRTVETLLHHATGIIEAERFAVHHRKTRLVPPGARRLVLGLLLADGDVRLAPWFRRQLEVHVRGTEKFGLRHHARYRKWTSLVSFVNHVEGRLAFAQSVDPAYTDRLRARWNKALAANGFPISAE
jgi:RNA-directed DNA polymerase